MRSAKQRREDRNRPSSAARGYGHAHQKLRALWAKRVNRGEVSCRRCGVWIAPEGRPCRRCGKPTRKGGRAALGFCGWDLGHADHDRDPKLCAPEHSCCNRATNGRGRLVRAVTKVRSDRW